MMDSSASDWCDDFFLPTSQKKLRDRYMHALRLLKDENIKVRFGQAGFFVWMDLRSFMREHTLEEEMDLFRAFITAGVYVVPGSELYCVTPGWFRLIMSVSDEELCEGIKRLSGVLKEWKRVLGRGELQCVELGVRPVADRMASFFFLRSAVGCELGSSQDESAWTRGSNCPPILGRAPSRAETLLSLNATALGLLSCFARDLL
ncbi:Aminotransferase class I/classII [Trinorchestia longiramus]|nr:Aminotransferase class I/classII [Trinorchestia longiramus]